MATRTANPEEYVDVMRDLMSHAPIGLAFVDPELRYVVADDSIAALTEMSAEDHIGKRVQDVVPELWPMLEPIFQRALAGETVLNVDVGADSPGPAPRRKLISFYPVHKGDELIGIEVVADDLTDLRDTQWELASRNHLYLMLTHATQAISASSTREELFQRICEIAVEEGGVELAWVAAVSDGTIVTGAKFGDDHGLFDEMQKRVSLAALDPASMWSLGPTGQSFINGKTTVFNRLAAELDSPSWQSAVDRLHLRSGASFPIWERGEVAAVLSLYASEPDCFEGGFLATLDEINVLLGHAMDRFALERQGKKVEHDLLLRDRALQASTQGAVIVDARADGQPIIYATPAFELLTGYSTEEILGQNCRVLQGVGTDPDAINAIGAALNGGQECTVEILNYRKNGEPFWNELTISPLFGDDGTLTHFIGVQSDATARHALERKARQAQKMEAVGQLAGGVAHDFNNILTVIRGEASLALSDATGMSSQQHIKQVDIAAQHAAALTHQLLAFSRQQVLKPKPTDLNKVVDKTLGLVARLIGDDIQLKENLGPELEAVLVDPGQLQQVIINLAINARDAMDDGGTISFRTTPCVIEDGYVLEEPMPFVLLEISDDGCGMDEQTQIKVFDPFFTTKDEGTGLGLATVYGIIKQSGGHISIRSEIGLGTTFMVYLPTTPEAIAEHDVAPRLLETLDGSETILHVEDSEMIRPLISRMLGGHGYEILSAANAKEAQEIAATHKGQIDLLLTDIVMPGLNGRELAENLHEDNPNLTVLFTSGYPADTVVRQGISEDEVNFIQKPFVAAELLPLVRSLLDDGADGAEAA